MAIVLEKQPQMLKMYGLDPDEVRAEIAKSKIEVARIEKNFDTEMQVNFQKFWTTFLAKYLEKLADSKVSDEDRKIQMDSVNPSFTLRNYLLEEAIRAAEKGDYSLVENML